MKKITLLLLFFSYGIFSSQEKFDVTETSFTDYVVTDVKGVKKEIIYKKTLEWIAKTFKSTNDVIQSKVTNDFVRFDGTQEGLFCERYKDNSATYCYPSNRYTIEISVKDGKYKFDITSIQYLEPSLGWLNVYVFQHGYGKASQESIELDKNMAEYFNRLNLDLKNYITGKKTSKDNW